MVEPRPETHDFSDGTSLQSATCKWWIIETIEKHLMMKTTN
jgi:hypothetical protein